MARVKREAIKPLPRLRLGGQVVRASTPRPKQATAALTNISHHLYVKHKRSLMRRKVSTILEDDCFRAMADPTRRSVMGMLARDELAVSDIADRLTISQPAVSQHLGVLKRSGLVRERKQGRFRYYRADPAGLRPVVNWIARYEAFWHRKLERLAALVDGVE